MIAQKEMGFPLACNQLNAVKSSYSHKLTFVTGGPGTGKTTILKAVLSVNRQLGGGKVLLMARPDWQQDAWQKVPDTREPPLYTVLWV